MMVNLTGGWGKELEESVAHWHTPHPDRFLVFVEPAYRRAADPGYARFQAAELERARRAGARGLKVTKMLGLYLREKITTGPLVKADDSRFDPMWDAAGALNMPVAIHTSDPEAFFLPIDRFNERYEELHAHPDWSFHGRDFPASRELHDARNRVMARHLKTQFLSLHLGVSEDLAYMTETLNRHPNAWAEFGARIGELGRQPRTARGFFDKFQDRILFGTDAIPRGDDTPQQVFGDKLYEIYYRFLETEDEYFDYSPAKTPPQGRWRISGLGLPEQVLRKVYFKNAERLLHLV
jgi:predicted TIM-barrel fold metal-dependent hydrolase